MTLNHPTCNTSPLIPGLFAFLQSFFVIKKKKKHMKGRCVLGPRQQQAAVGLRSIQCNLTNTSAGWPYLGQAAIHFRNVVRLPA